MRVPLLLFAWTMLSSPAQAQEEGAAAEPSPFPQIISDALWNECKGLLVDPEEKFCPAGLFNLQSLDDGTLKRMEKYVRCIEAIIDSALDKIGRVDKADVDRIFDD